MTTLTSPPHSPDRERDTVVEHPAVHGGHDDDPQFMPPPPKLRWWQGLLLLALIGGTIGGLYYVGREPRVARQQVLAHEVQRLKTTLPKVQVIAPRRSPAEAETVLPGDVQAVEETTIYARTSGYLRKWLVDIGDQVKEGQLLAEIDTPEIDQQLRQAEATLEQYRARKKTAETSYQLATATLRRVESVPEGVITKQEIDERRAQLDTAASVINAAEADIAASQADVQRIKELQSFSKVYAPFAGTITARNVELGQLVTSGNDQAQSLFRLSKTNPVRVFINVPQIYAPSVRQGLEARLIVRELPGRQFIGKVSRTAGAIDPVSRTLLTEVQVPNDDGMLLVGSYVQVLLKVVRDNPPLLVPASSLIFNSEGTKLAVVDDQDHIQLRDVTLEGDYGPELGVAFGINETDRVVSNPGDRLTQGMHVAIMTSDKEQQQKPAAKH